MRFAALSVGLALTMSACASSATHVVDWATILAQRGNIAVITPQPRNIPAVAAPYCTPPGPTTTTAQERQLLIEEGYKSGVAPSLPTLPTCSWIVVPRDVPTSSVP